MQHFSEATVLIVGTVRNVERTIRNDIVRLREATSGFRAVKWFVVESDSSDKSVNMLQQLAREVPDFRYVSLGKLRKSIRSRPVRLAYCRNTYLDSLEKDPGYANTDYLIVADLDGVNTALTRRALESCWQFDNWDACFANQIGPYNDIWALRHPYWSPNDCWLAYHSLLALTQRKRFARKVAVLDRMVTISPKSAPIEVVSAFGGLGIYVAPTLRGLRYSGQLPDGQRICEHVPLNEEIVRRGGRLLINPAMTNRKSPGKKKSL